MNKLVVSIAVSMATFALAPAVMAKDNDARAITVNFGELNLASESDANQLYRKLRTAAREVCGHNYGRDLRQRTAFEACYSRALSDAVVQVNRSAVTTLHERARRG